MGLASILAPVDFSEDSARGARLAGRIARRHAARLTLLYVDGLPDYSRRVAREAAPASWVDYLERRDEALRQRLREFAHSVEVGDDANIALSHGNPEQAITEHARAGAYDLIVISPRGSGYGQQFLIGSVSAAVASSATCPVLVARMRSEAALLVSEFAEPLVAVADPPLAEQALESTLLLSQKGTTIHLLHVLESFEVTVGPPLSGAFQDAVQRRSEELRVELGRRAETAKSEGFQTSVHVVTGDPSFSILCHLESKPNGLVVVSRKTGGHDPGHLGTPAYRMVKHSPVPVLVVPQL